jgi:hypothetical protein
MKNYFKTTRAKISTYFRLCNLNSLLETKKMPPRLYGKEGKPLGFVKAKRLDLVERIFPRGFYQ